MDEAHYRVVLQYLRGEDVRVTPSPLSAEALAAVGEVRGATLRSGYESAPCPACAATGTLPDRPTYREHAGHQCVVCWGTGRIPTLATLRAAAQNVQAALRSRERMLAEGRRWIAMAQRALRGEGDLGYQVTVIDDDGVRQVLDPTTDAAALVQHIAAALKIASDLEDEIEVIRGDMRELERHTRATRRLRRSLKAAVREYEQAAAAAPVVAPAARPAHCRTPGCQKPPQVWDAEGRGWCRRHAHRRGLLQREAVPGDEEA
jgi:hypothetical protein